MYPRPSAAWQRQNKGIHYLYAFLETGRGSNLKKMMHMGCKGGFAHTSQVCGKRRTVSCEQRCQRAFWMSRWPRTQHQGVGVDK